MSREDDIKRLEDVLALLASLGELSKDLNVAWGIMAETKLRLMLNIDENILKQTDLENSYKPDFLMYDGKIPILRVEVETLKKIHSQPYDKTGLPLRCFTSRGLKQLSACPQCTLYVSQYRDGSSILVAWAIDVLSCPIDGEFYDLESIRNKIMVFNNIEDFKKFLLDEYEKRKINHLYK